LDVRAAVDFVLKQSPEERIGVLGYSMGAVAAIGAAAQDHRIDAVVAVSPYASLRETMTYRLKGVRPLTDLIAWWGERITGLCLDAVRPEELMGVLSPRPVLIMQAEADEMVPQNSGKRLYEAAAEPKELWSVPGVAHVGFRQEVPDAYKRRVLGFFQQHLPPDD
jgi:alpha-beta hydrolase superfamily lysophospholipase